MRNKITIVTVCLNSEKTIEETIKSVSNQTHPEVEHLIIDGGSTDKTLSLIDKCKKCNDKIRLISEIDNGIYDAMNKGIRLATGEIIGFVNSDDIFANNSILSQVSNTINFLGVDGCYADLLYIDRTNKNKFVRYWKTGKLNYLSLGWIPPHPTFYLRKSTYLKYGLYNLDYGVASDHELISRYVSNAFIKLVYVPKIWVKMRLGGKSNRNFFSYFYQNYSIIRGLLSNNIQVSPIFPIYKLLVRRQQYHKGKLLSKMNNLLL